REVLRLNDIPSVRLGVGDPADEQVVDLLMNKVAVPLEIRLVDIQTCCDTEESLEFGYTRDWHGATSSHLRAITGRSNMSRSLATPLGMMPSFSKSPYQTISGG